MEILLAIKPEFAQKIFDGEKRYEYRKTIFKNSEIKKVIMYVSHPVKKILGEFSIEMILSDYPDKIWEKTRDYSGISKSYFFNYVGEKNLIHAIKIKSFRKYKQPLYLKEHFNLNSPPQSFRYI